jgi:lysophospholipase L1-like esterase
MMRSTAAAPPPCRQQAAHLLLAALLAGSSCLSAVQARATQLSEVRVLAIGDSITEGSVPSRGANHPYTNQLRVLLQQKYPGANIVIDNKGG